VRLLGVLLAITVALTGCGSPDERDREASGLPTGQGPLSTGSITWATGDTIHVGDRTITVGEPVHAMVGARGRIYYLAGRSETLWVTDGQKSRRTGYETDELRASRDGRYLGLFDHSRGMPWSTVILDLSSGEVVVDDDAGMGDPDDDLADLYEDAQPRVLGFEGDALHVRAASGNDVLSWDAGTGERTSHGSEFFFHTPDPGGGRLLPALVERGRLVVPDDPYRSTQWGHQSPDGALTLQPTGRGTDVFAVESGEELPADLKGRTFLLGGWTDPDAAYGIAFAGSPFGRRVRLVSCRLTLEERHCRVLRTIQPPRHQLVLFPTGSPATDY
jgi:hypothetical protein